MSTSTTMEDYLLHPFKEILAELDIQERGDDSKWIRLTEIILGIDDLAASSSPTRMRAGSNRDSGSGTYAGSTFMQNLKYKVSVKSLSSSQPAKSPPAPQLKPSSGTTSPVAALDTLLGDGILAVDVKITAHSKEVQAVMNTKGIAWPVQYELVHAVTLGRWTWGDISSQKLDSLEGTAAVAAPKVHAVMTGRSEVPAEVTVSFNMSTSKDQTIWDAGAASVEGQGRRLGLMGDFRSSKNWFGGQIQQIVRLLPDGSMRLERPEMTRSNRFARFLSSRRMIKIKLPKTANFDADGSVRVALARKFVLCGRVFVPIDAKDGKGYLKETSEDYECGGRESEGDLRRMSFAQFIQLHNTLSRNSKQEPCLVSHADFAVLVKRSAISFEWAMYFALFVELVQEGVIFRTYSA
ncbi:hypothetical protein DENSPDRAFT_886867 [Dentipellis sp. KUC8613]|nr:hypothetical protein DENSPDRAFT_886867 [Dentipellis sp. KUC8613]